MKAFAVAAVAAVAVDAFPAVMQGLGALPETLHKRDFAQPVSIICCGYHKYCSNDFRAAQHLSFATSISPFQMPRRTFQQKMVQLRKP